MAGCICEQEDKLYSDIEGHEAKKLISTTHVSDAVAHEMAHQTVSYRKDVDERYKDNDRQGLEGQGPNFEFTADGNIFFPEYKDSLRDMYERQRILRPKEYDVKEYETVWLAYQSLKDGATQAAHIVHHYDKNGQVDVRDVVVLTFDHDAKKGTMHSLNISNNGENHHSLESAYDAMKTRLDGFGEAVQKDDTCVLVREESAINPVSLFHQKLCVVQEKTSIPTNELRNELVQIYMINLRLEERPSVDQNIPIHIPFYLQKLLSRDEKGELVERPTEKQDLKQKHNRPLFKEASLEKPHTVLHAPETQKDNLVGFLIEEKKIIADRKKDKNPLQVLFERKKVAGSQETSQKDKKEKTHFKKEIHVDRVELARQIEVIKDVSIPSKRERKILYKERKRERKVRKRHIRLFEQFRNMIKMFEKRKREDIKKHRYMERKILGKKGPRKQEHTTFKLKGKESTRQRKKEMKVLRKKEAKNKLTLQFIQGYILFVLFSYGEKIGLQKTNENVRKERTSQNIKREHYKAPWILFSIIWYLTMIREQGLVQYQPKKKQKKSGKKKKRTGIIFDRSQYHLAAQPLSIML